MRSSFCTPAAAVLASGLLLLLAGCDLGSVGPDPAQDAGFTGHSSSNVTESLAEVKQSC